MGEAVVRWCSNRHFAISVGLLTATACGGDVASDGSRGMSNVGGGPEGGQTATGGATQGSSTTSPPATETGGMATTATTATGAASSSGGTTSTTGAASSSGGTTSTTAGTAAIGGTASTGGTPTTGGTATLESTLAEFCTGSVNKVLSKGQLLQPAATRLAPTSAYRMKLHTKDFIGSDIVISISNGTGSAPVAGAYDLPYPWSAVIDTSTAAAGKVLVEGDTPGSGPWKLGVCVQLSDVSVSRRLDGTLVYVPGVPMDYVGLDPNRFAIWRLADLTITLPGAAQAPLDSLTLAQNPWVSLSIIDNVDEATGLVSFISNLDPYQTFYQPVNPLPPEGLPFVAVADGVRIYLGGYFAASSSVGVAYPTIYSPAIATDMSGITIRAPYSGSTPPNDPRFDPRIVKVLTETGRFVPAGG